MKKQEYHRSVLIPIQRRLGKKAGELFASAVYAADGLRYPVRRMRNFRENFCGIAPFDPQQDTIAQNTCREERTRIIELAEQFIRKNFSLLGGQISYEGGKINWHRDFKSGYEWDSKLHGTRVPVYADSPGSDIKIPWELSRGHHFVTLGLAYRLTGDRKYFEAYGEQIDQWIASNPVPFGVNWVCSMDIAIRAVNWIVAGWLFQDLMSGGESKSFRNRFLKSLWHHGIHLSRNPEWRGPQHPRGNHFAADLTGLFTLGVLFRNCRTGAGWLSMSRSLLEQEMAYQVLKDGVHHERSTTYHRMMYEMFLFCDRLGMRTGFPFSPAYRQRLKSMEEFLLALLPVGAQKIPQIGDNDDGHLLDPVQSPPDSLTGLFPNIAGTETSSIERFMLAGEWNAAA
ncbi:MAG: hypothetical protein IT583_00920, partial [Verrucomicrobia bacterium]|nr:hypothetical protein [Verrucomicrobiota bacterium]